MKETKIIVAISDEGDISIDASGFSGNSCISEIEKILDSLAPTMEIEKKSDYYSNTQKVTKINLKGGDHR